MEFFAAHSGLIHSKVVTVLTPICLRSISVSNTTMPLIRFAFGVAPLQQQQIFSARPFAAQDQDSYNERSSTVQFRRVCNSESTKKPVIYLWLTLRQRALRPIWQDQPLRLSRSTRNHPYAPKIGYGRLRKTMEQEKVSQLLREQAAQHRMAHDSKTAEIRSSFTKFICPVPHQAQGFF
jgi:hypothetical protein